MRTPRRWIGCANLALVTTVVVVGARPVNATHRTVRADGTGDYPTISAAVAAMYATHPADSLIIEPGGYDEIVNFPGYLDHPVVAPGGPDQTWVRGITSLPENNVWLGSSYAAISGLRILETVAWGGSTHNARWTNCVFEGGFHGQSNWGRGFNVEQCTFRDTSSFVHYGGSLRSCTFEGAPIYVENILGYIRMDECTFTGPASALLTIRPRDESNVVAKNCTFSDADRGIAVYHPSDTRQDVDVIGCRFERLTGAALHYEDGDWKLPESGRLALSMSASRVVNCGQAVRIFSPKAVQLRMVADTIESTSGPAIEGSLRGADLQGLVIREPAGDGMRLYVHSLVDDPDEWPYLPFPWLQLGDCIITSGGGDGISIQQIPDQSPSPQEVTVRNIRIDGVANEGIHMETPYPIVTGSLVRGAGGNGIRLAPSGSSPACSLAYNTIHGAGGHGIRIESVRQITPTVVTRNLLTGNGLGGLLMNAPYIGSASYNNSWGNWVTGFDGLRDEEINLYSNPLYCDAAAADFTLHGDSPCGPFGPYGLIGALGVGCAATLSVPATSPSPRFAMTPNPARGSVSFAWGEARTGFVAEEASSYREPIRLEVLDIQGRVRWRTTMGEAVSGEVRWDGRDLGGRLLAAGVYLARWRDARTSGTTRLVWLGP
jgi:hypothetical protein